MKPRMTDTKGCEENLAIMTTQIMMKMIEALIQMTPFRLLG